MKATKWLLGIVVLAGAAGAVWYYYFKDAKKVQYLTARLERGNIESVVSATGSCNAVVSVQVGSQVSGNIMELHADYNTKVTKGQVVAVIDPSPFQSRVDQAKANLDSARASVLNATSSLKKSESDVAGSIASVANQKANVVRANSAVMDAKNRLDRRVEMFAQKVVSREDRDTAQANYDQAVASLEAARAQLTSAEAQLESTKAQQEVVRTQTITAQSQVKQQEANLQQANFDLERTRITAPVDGVVIARNMDVGQTVAASFSAPTIFQIAQDLTKMQVDTNIDESDISRIQLGQEATFTVDAYSGQVFRGEVKQVRRNPINVQNVITYVVVIGVDNPDLKLFPGMTANVRILTDRAANVVRVPSAALRVRLENAPTPAKGKDAPKEFTRDGSKGPDSKEGAKEDGKQVQTGKNGKESAEAAERFAALRERFGSGAGGFNGGQGGGGRGRGNRGGGEGGAGGGGNGRGGGGAFLARSGAGGAPQIATVYLMGDDGQPRAERVRLGIGDGSFVAALSPNLREGMTIITGVLSSAPAAAAPGFPGQQQNQKNKNFRGGGFPF